MTHSVQGANFRQTIWQALPGMAGVALITGVCLPLHLDFAIVGCLYLLLVVLLSAFVRFASSALVSVTAIACLDYCFVPPIFKWNLSRPLDGLALGTFLATALVVTRLASKAREEARTASARRTDLAWLYELASRLVAVSPAVAVERNYLGLFREVFHLRAVCLFDGDAAVIASDGEPGVVLGYATKEAYISGQDYYDRQAKIAIRCFRIDGKVAGAVGFEGLNEAESLAGPLSMLAAAMVQRARSFETASAAAAATQVELLRSAVLDAFAHQFKTPLAAILTAAGGLRETGRLAPEQEEMLETIETQAAGLGHLTTRLLRMARLDRDEIKPKLQNTDISALVRRIAKRYTTETEGHVLGLDVANDAIEVQTDPEMLGLAIVQLVDNAFRYSRAGAGITVSISGENEQAVVRVTNEGSSILPEEQGRIFERFYRGSAGHQVTGTGLGLYVARKIVVAHGGTLELEADKAPNNNTTFRLRLPLAKQEARHELKAS
jgi:two-component system sensor histidine kinase KdpD